MKIKMIPKRLFERYEIDFDPLWRIDLFPELLVTQIIQIGAILNDKSAQLSSLDFILVTYVTNTYIYSLFNGKSLTGYVFVFCTWRKHFIRHFKSRN